MSPLRLGSQGMKRRAAMAVAMRRARRARGWAQNAQASWAASTNTEV
jgi:hypothetical protein